MIDNKAVMQQALDWMLNHGGIVFAGGGMNAVDPMNKVAQDLRKSIAQPVKPHDLQKRLEALHQYEDIAEHYAKCAISPEALRDWVAERMDMPAISQPEQRFNWADVGRLIEVTDQARAAGLMCGTSNWGAFVCKSMVAQLVEPDLAAAAQAVLDRWNSPQWEWVKSGPTGDLMQVLRNALDSIYIPAAIAQPVTQADIDHVFETLYDHGNGKYRGAVSKAQRDKAIAICEALKSAQHLKELK